MVCVYASGNQVRQSIDCMEARCARVVSKHGKGSVANDVTDEMVRLNWLTGIYASSTIKHFIRTPDDAWLLTTALPG